MDFRQATDRARAACIRLPDIAEATKASPAAIKQARMDPENEAFRNPPQGWERALAKLARKRARALDRLADRLEK